ncbi:phage baseplate protein [Iningainema tapete]|uniref:Phage baseplate protein n=1 Tax=Iningainema tapete BLCC-T55 TaxID=2748662 RepID=A0A8J6XIH5_9CYAN|nr:phage baseplate protein [Iningainema tapete]MBD2773382.1 phage baseplate protein [Iningainema tapete BLCC-T55]
MRSPSALELLNAWEWGLSQHPIQRALKLLAVAFPQTPLKTLAQLSIGQRDAYLLTLRELVFGSQLISLATCPHCSECLELTLNSADIKVGAELSLPETKPQETFTVDIADCQVQFRLPNSLDIAALASQDHIADSQQYLLNRCVLAVHCHSEQQTNDQLPPNLWDAVVQRMAEVDPQADVQFKLVCPVCKHQWQVVFDILSFFWKEIDAWAYRILREVHTLACIYGWGEAEILALSPHRRQFYLQLVAQKHYGASVR